MLDVGTLYIDYNLKVALDTYIPYKVMCDRIGSRHCMAHNFLPIAFNFSVKGSLVGGGTRDWLKYEQCTATLNQWHRESMKPLSMTWATFTQLKPSSLGQPTA